MKVLCADEVRLLQESCAEKSFGGEAVEWVWFGAWLAVLFDDCGDFGE